MLFVRINGSGVEKKDGESGDGNEADEGEEKDDERRGKKSGSEQMRGYFRRQTYVRIFGTNVSTIASARVSDFAFLP